MNDFDEFGELSEDFERLWKIGELTNHLYVAFDKRKGANSRDHYRNM